MSTVSKKEEKSELENTDTLDTDKPDTGVKSLTSDNKGSSLDSMDINHSRFTSSNTAANRNSGSGPEVGPGPAVGVESRGSGFTSICYFMLELVDPQLNFLDTKSHSSVIMAAGRSSLMGHRETTALLVPIAPSAEVKSTKKGKNREGRDGVKKEPKRQNEIQLLMDKVSAFTVPTVRILSSADILAGLIEDGEDQVFWKEKGAKIEEIVRRRTDSIFQKPVHTGGVKGQSMPSRMKRGGENDGADDQVDEQFRHREREESISMNKDEKKDNPNLRVAIKDFDLRSTYTFWMDVTVKEANKMYVRREIGGKDLVCSFLLDLPELCLDITSSQFHIGISYY
jgi:hypothetical protein